MHPDKALTAPRWTFRRAHGPAVLSWLIAGLVVAAAAMPLAAREGGRFAAAGRAHGAAQAASTLCVNAVQDGSVFEVQPDVSGGVSTTLKVGPAARLRTHAYMQFDLAGVPADAIVVSATLRAYLEDLQFQSVPVMTTELLAVADNWDEASLTWNKQPGGGTSFGTRNHDDTTGIKTWNALGLIDHWRTVDNFGVVIEGRINPLIGNSFVATFTARESTAHPGPSLCMVWVLPTYTPTVTITPTLTLTPTATSLFSPTPEPTNDNRATLTPTEAVTATATIAPTASPTDDGPVTPTATTVPGNVVGIVVTDRGDGDDTNPADGKCADASGECTLRAALQHAADLPAGDSVTIRFARAMGIVVPHGRPLPPIARDGLAVIGVQQAPPPGLAAWRVGRVDAPTAQGALRPGVAITGLVAGQPSVDAGLRVEGDGARIQSLDISGFAAGVLLADGAQAALVGADDDGIDDRAEGNLLHGNRDGLRIEAGSMGHTIRSNALVANIRHGIAVARTAGEGNHITRNAITRNGRAAIAVDRGGAQVPQPVIVQVDPRTGTVQGTGCPGCIVEVFTDNAEQAARYVDGGTVGVQADGTWSVGGLALRETDGNVTATATRSERAGQSTSRLSAPVPRDASARWRLVEVPPSLPRVLVGRRIRRDYRLVDALGRPVNEAVLSFRPYDDVLRFESLRGGLVEVVIPTALALDLWRGQLHITLEAVEQRTGARHTVDWLPRMGAALELPIGDPLLLDLSDLSEEGLGAIVRRVGGVARADAGAAPMRAAQGADAVAVGFLVSPAESREGPYAWQENLAAGGGVYQLAPGDDALAGLLEIQAPVAAYDAGGASSACPGAPQGAVIAGWREQDICWVPVPGASAVPPGAGEATFAVTAPVDIPPAGALGATTAYTLYTVGHDTSPPVILPQLTAGAAVATLPAVLASAVDDASGVRATTGVSVTLGGVSVPVTYDAASREIRVPPAARGMPADLPEGPAILAFAVEDGFCNRATRTVSVTIVRSALTPIYLPRAQRAR